MGGNEIEEVRKRMNEAGRDQAPFLFAFSFEMNEALFVESPLEQNRCWFQVGENGNKNAFPPAKILQPPTLFPSVLSVEAYKAKFDRVQRGLLQGDSFLTNLTVCTPVAMKATLADVFSCADAPYQLYLPGRFVCFSPERFVRIKGGGISTNPMKGTIDASVPDAAEVILNDPKETAEHCTIVDLLRNDLSIVAKDVQVGRFRYLDRIQSKERTLLQVSSEITGRLFPEYEGRLGDLFLKLLPAGSVSGAPKHSTLQIIREAESEPRGYYTGVFGYFDGRTLDSAVMIRFIEERNGQYFYRSGGGITAYSRWENEYQEVLDKIYIPVV